MGATFAAFRDNPALRVAIITGAGDKFFCAGWDLKAAAHGEAVDSDYGVGGFGGLQELPGLNKPVIAAVNGICCGGRFGTRALGRPDLGVGTGDLRVTRDQIGHDRRCCDTQTAKASSISRCDGASLNRPLDGCNRSASLGSGQ